MIDYQGVVEYPEAAQRLGVSGRVLVEYMVDESGNVVNPSVLESDHPLLSTAALEAVGKLRFDKPALQDGRPVRARGVLPIVFRSGQDVNVGNIPPVRPESVFQTRHDTCFPGPR